MTALLPTASAVVLEVAPSFATVAVPSRVEPLKNCDRAGWRGRARRCERAVRVTACPKTGKVGE